MNSQLSSRSAGRRGLLAASSFWLGVRLARKPLLIIVALLAVLGGWAYHTAPRSIFPQVSFSRIEIFLWAGSLPPEEMRATVTRPLETALSVLPVLETRSFTNQGTTEIELDFDPASDPRADLQSVQAVVAATRPSLGAVTVSRPSSSIPTWSRWSPMR